MRDLMARGTHAEADGPRDGEAPPRDGAARIAGSPERALRAAVACAAVLVLLAALAAADLARPPRPGRSLQGAVGGLGLGGSLDFSGCPEALDPRVEPCCADRLSALPASGAPCRRHAGSGGPGR